MNSVVLPAPFGPIRAQISPALDVEAQPVERDDTAEADSMSRTSSRAKTRIPSSVPASRSPSAASWQWCGVTLSQ